MVNFPLIVLFYFAPTPYHHLLYISYISYSFHFSLANFPLVLFNIYPPTTCPFILSYYILYIYFRFYFPLLYFKYCYFIYAPTQHQITLHFLYFIFYSFTFCLPGKLSSSVIFVALIPPAKKKTDPQNPI